MNVRNHLLGFVAISFFVGSYTLGSESAPERIEAIYFDHGKVAKLYLYPGRTSLLDFPCEVTRAVGGPAGDIQWEIGATDKSELDVWLKSGASQPTNLTVRCHKQVFVFDVIPSRSNHQEYIEILGSFGGASLKGAETIQSSKSVRDEYVDKKLIATSSRDSRTKSATGRAESISAKSAQIKDAQE